MLKESNEMLNSTPLFESVRSTVFYLLKLKIN